MQAPGRPEHPRLWRCHLRSRGAVPPFSARPDKETSHMNRCLLLSLALFAGWGLPAAAETTGDPEAKLDAYVRGQLEQLKVPGASVAVVRDGKVVLSRGY